MEATRQNWTDDRMDDLAKQVDAGFSQARVDMGSMCEELRGEIKDVRGEMKAQGEELREEIKAQGQELRKEMQEQARELRGEMAGLRSDMGARLDSIDTRFDTLHATLISGQRTTMQILGGLCAALIAVCATAIAAVV